MKYFPIIIMFLALISCALESEPPMRSNLNDISIHDLIEQMSLKEKIGQMNQYNGFWDATGPAPNEGDAKLKYDHLRSGMVGSVLNVSGVENVLKMQKTVVEETRLGIPLIFGLDVIHGHKTLSPIPLAEAASWDLEAIERSARIAAVEASARGINWTFAPMVDISRDARWGRVMEGAGEDPYLGSVIGRARVQGFQGDDLSLANTVIATAKHFAGYGFSEAGRDYNAVDVGMNTLYNVILPPFRSCVDAGVRTVMNSFSTMNGVPSTGDEFLQRKILKETWGFDGFVISDWSSAKEMIDHGFAVDLEHAAVLAAKAGSDMDMESYAYVNHLEEAVLEGKLDESLIDDAVYRILKVKKELGLFEDPYRYCDTLKENELIYHEDHMEAALDMAKKSIVLLKNENATLPLSTQKGGIAVIGELAGDKNSPLGSWRIGSDDSTAVSLIEGLKNHDIDFKYHQGVKLLEGESSFTDEVQINEHDDSGIQEAVDLARKSELVIMVLGEHGFQSGEGRSRTKLDFPGLQQEMLEAVYSVNKNIVLVVMSGRPLVLTWADEHVPAIVQAWQLGTQSGNAIAEVLLGKYNPSGKLPMCFPRSVGQVPLYYNQLNTGRPGPSDQVFWSHYIDEENSALYPFGYGLSYTDFEYSDLRIENNYSEDNKIKFSIELRNSGGSKGKEVVQLYIRDVVASISRPVKELKAFELVELEAGEKKIIEFIIGDSSLGFYNNQGEYRIESGEFEVFVGGSSATGLSTSFRID